MRLLLAFLASCLALSAASARVISSDAEFQAAVLAPTTVSFNLFSAGFLPQTTVQLGAVSVQLTSAGSAPIFGPGPLGFTTNFLSTGVQDGSNNVVITLTAGTRAAGMKIASIFPVTVTASYASGSESMTFSASQVSFLAFVESAGLQGLQRITISSPFIASMTPIVNVGDITYASALAAPAVESAIGVPTLDAWAIFLLALLLGSVGVARVRRRGLVQRRR